MVNKSALYYPYINFQDEEWLKSALLTFPSVYRMVPGNYSPRDSEFVEELTYEGLISSSNLRTNNIQNALSRLLENFENDLSNDSQFKSRFDKAAVKKLKKSGSPSFQIHEGKAKYLLDDLKRLELAWEPKKAYGDKFLELHPRVGEVIMSTLALECAMEDGLSVVGEEFKLHDCLIRNEPNELYEKIIKDGELDNRELLKPDHTKIELMVFQEFDKTSITPEIIKKLKNERDPLDRFRNKIGEIAEKIPKMRNEKKFESILENEVREIISKWKNNKKNLSPSARNIFKESLKPTGDYFKKLAENIAGPMVSSTMTGGSFGGGQGALIGATAGLAVGLIFHGVSTSKALKKAEKENPYHFLTLVEENGGIFTTGS